MNSSKSSKHNVQNTTYEAASSKLSAVKLGYYDDPFLKHFVKRIETRSPLINRGYYARVAALRLYIELFFKSIDNQKYQDVKYYEIDFYDLLKEKTDIIKKYTEMKNFLKYEKDNEEKDEDLINCLNYKMVPLDLNDSSSFEKILLSYNFDFNKPTIFICECVLIYLETESSDNLIKKLSELMKNTSCIIVYEQVNPNTAFGKVMIDNFSHRGINLKSIYKYYNLQTQLERYKSLGWVNVYINDMNEIYDYHINMEEKKKIELIEMFDEFEEWRLLQNHYFILVAFNCYNNINLEELKQFLTCQKEK
ncbi:hypothetical protein PFHG_00306 [Plasmodium falciparum HB3]|uniref:Leucine carboxyl methyltransferase 1 n=1 Tax=Plasmodium falciparum (isolate HB3) TaxID=137071 RepID=A0A0L7K5A3_PLAFX|nr:hypothetical protein PFHG_00306 [Plasmodium falciparum HB3]